MFTSQQSIDNFSVTYPNCTIIEGDLEIPLFKTIDKEKLKVDDT